MSFSLLRSCIFLLPCFVILLNVKLKLEKSENGCNSTLFDVHGVLEGDGAAVDRRGIGMFFVVSSVTKVMFLQVSWVLYLSCHVAVVSQGKG